MLVEGRQLLGADAHYLLDRSIIRQALKQCDKPAPVHLPLLLDEVNAVVPHERGVYLRRIDGEIHRTDSLFPFAELPFRRAHYLLEYPLNDLAPDRRRNIFRTAYQP